MLDDEFVKWFTTLGIGGILAAFMFSFYRKDVKQYTELWKSATEQLINVVKDNTEANTKLTVLLESQERNAMRKGDIETIITRILQEELNRRAKEVKVIKSMEIEERT